MKTLFVFFAMVLVVVPAAMASTTTCPNTSLDHYVASGFTCISGNLMFSNFQYTSAASAAYTPLATTDISVAPQTITMDEGFQFQGNFLVTSQGGLAEFQDSVISFTISTVNHQATIDDLALGFNGQAGGTGSAKVTEKFCINGSVATCATPVGQIVVTNPPPTFSNTVLFAPVSSIGVSKDINVTSGTNGTASISQVLNQYSQTTVPEPTALVLMGAGLLGLGMLRRRAVRS